MTHVYVTKKSFVLVCDNCAAPRKVEAKNQFTSEEGNQPYYDLPKGWERQGSLRHMCDKCVAAVKSALQRTRSARG